MNKECLFRVRFLFLLSLAALLLQVTVTCPEASAGNDGSTPRIMRVGYFRHTNTLHRPPSVGYYGYSYEYLNEIAQYQNWDLIFVQGTEKECVEWLEEGRLDIICHVHKRSDYDSYLDCTTEEAGTCRVGLYALRMNRNHLEGDLSSFAMKKIGIFAPEKQRSALKKSFLEADVPVTYVTFDNEKDVIKALNNSSVDGALISGNSIPNSFKLITLFSDEPFYFAVRKGESALLTRLDTAMRTISILDPSYKNDLFKKHYGVSVAWDLSLTPAEKEYVLSSPKLTASYDPMWMPFEYYDHDKGKMAGIDADVLGLLQAYTGLTIEVVHSPTWEEALKKIREGKIDILTGVNRSFAWGEKNNFRVSHAFISAPIVMVVGRDKENLMSKVALPKNYYLSEIVSSFYKFDDIVYYETPQECFEALLRKDVTATFANSYVANHLVGMARYKGLSTLNIGDLNEKVAVGISKKCPPTLLSIINKGLLSIPEEKINGIVIEHSFSKRKASLIDLIYEHHVYLAKGLTAMLIFTVCALAFVAVVKSRDKAELKKLFYYDSLTGHKNFNSFVKDAPIIIKKHTDIEYALLFIDIVEFKFINNTFGYEEGDKVLKGIAAFIEKNVDPSFESFARVNADRFVMLLGYKDLISAEARIRALFDDLEGLYSHESADYNLIFNGGVYLFENSDVPINIAVDNAAFAKNSIKQRHKTAYTFYDKNTLIRINEEKSIEATMRGALAGGEFVPFLQPKIDCYTGEPIGAEALARWIKPDGSVMLPDLFIPYFEKSGFVTKLDMYMFGEICGIIRRWMDEGKKVLPLSCNFSYLDLADRNFVENLNALAEKHCVPPNMLELELTESTAAEHIELVESRGGELSALGFRLSIDDFGAGYSSLSLLQKLRMDVLKLDRDFVRRGLNGKLSHDLVSGLVRAFKQNSMQVVFEGIENEEHLDFVKSLGCSIIQGYYYSKPLPVDEFEKKYICP